MTFKQFLATKVWSDDLSKALSDAAWENDPVPPRGWVYGGSYFIDQVLPHWPEETRKRGGWHLLLERCEWITDDLSQLEQRLFAWAATEEGCKVDMDSVQKIAREFPDYDVCSLPEMPDGFTCTAWHNDTAPTWTEGLSSDELKPGVLMIATDYPNRADREIQRFDRFDVLMHERSGNWKSLWHGDNAGSIATIVQFARYVRELGIGFNPDTRGRDYIGPGDFGRYFDAKEAAAYDANIEAMFGIVGDVHELAITIWKVLELVTPEEAKRPPAYDEAAVPHIIITGDPTAGFEFYGPFKSVLEASEHGNNDPHLRDWWVAPLNPAKLQ